MSLISYGLSTASFSLEDTMYPIRASSAEKPSTSATLPSFIVGVVVNFLYSIGLKNIAKDYLISRSDYMK